MIGNVLLGESASDPRLSPVLLIPDLVQNSLTVLNVMSSSRKQWRGKDPRPRQIFSCFYLHVYIYLYIYIYTCTMWIPPVGKLRNSVCPVAAIGSLSSQVLSTGNISP